MAIVQRFGGGINLNVHTHVLVIDGVFARDGVGVRFCPAPPLTDLDVAEVLATIVPRVRRLLERRGMGEGDEGAGAPDGGAEDMPVLAGLAAASVQGTFALGARAGRPVRRCGAAPEQDTPSTRACGSPPTIERVSNGSVGTPCDHRWRRTGSTSPRRGRSSCSSGTRGRMARRTSCSIPSNSWSASPS